MNDWKILRSERTPEGNEWILVGEETQMSLPKPCQYPRVKVVKSVREGNWSVSVSEKEAMETAKIITQAHKTLDALKKLRALVFDDVLVRNTKDDHDFKKFTKQGFKITEVLLLVEDVIKKSK